MARYSITIEAGTLPELVGAVTEAAGLLQAGDASVTIATEVAQLAAPFPDAIAGTALDLAPAPTGLPMPAPDYVGTGLTDHQQMQVRQALSQPQAAPGSVAVATSPAAPDGSPFCPIHMRPMTWKGGGLSKNGKGLPLWSCPDTACKEAIWPPR